MTESVSHRSQVLIWCWNSWLADREAGQTQHFCKWIRYQHVVYQRFKAEEGVPTWCLCWELFLHQREGKGKTGRRGRSQSQCWPWGPTFRQCSPDQLMCSVSQYKFINNNSQTCWHSTDNKVIIAWNVSHIRLNHNFESTLLCCHWDFIVKQIWVGNSLFPLSKLLY